MIRRTHRSFLITLALLAGIGTATMTQQSNPYVGAWTLTPDGSTTGPVYWLEVKEQNGQLTGMFLNGGGHALPLAAVRVENGELVFVRNAQTAQEKQTVQYKGRVIGGKLVIDTITTAITRLDDPARTPAAPTVRKVTWTGVRPPAWPATNANGAHTYGAPVVLFDGTSLDAFVGQNENRPLNWMIENGVMTNSPRPANNLVSKQKFQDFRVDAEYKLTDHSNSGIYLRGRYELQVLDDVNDTTTEPFLTHMAIYGRVPPAVKASKPIGEWQTMQAIMVGNRVTVTLNGKRVHDNVAIVGVTGGALNGDELSPGPLMIQGDHEQVWFRKVVVTPITAAGR